MLGEHVAGGEEKGEKSCFLWVPINSVIFKTQLGFHQLCYRGNVVK